MVGPVRGACGTDEPTQTERRRILEQAGFADVAVLEDHFTVPVDVEFVLGHVYSALPLGQLADNRRGAFADGCAPCCSPMAKA